VIPEDLSLTFMNGRQNAVDVLTGSNKDEANFGRCGGGGRRGRGGPEPTLETFRTNAQRRFGDAVDDYVKLYGVTTDAEVQAARVMVLGDTPQVEAATPTSKLSFYQAAYQRLLKTSGTN
jgi:hypothetical protein